MSLERRCVLLVVGVLLVGCAETSSRVSHQAHSSPSGVLVFAMIGTESADSNIFAADAGGSGLVQLTNYEGPDQSPSLSADGSRIAFSSDRDDPGNLDLYTMNADGSDVVRVTASPHIDGGPTWSPDGQWIAFWRSSSDGTWQGRLVRSDGSADHVLPGSRSGDADFSWSPDGNYLALTRNVSGSVGVMVLDAATGETVREFDSSGSEATPSWFPSNDVLFVRNASELVSASLSDPQIALPHTFPGSIHGATIASDGQYAAVQTYGYDSAEREGALGRLFIVDLATGVRTEIGLPGYSRLLHGVSW